MQDFSIIVKNQNLFFESNGGVNLYEQLRLPLGVDIGNGLMAFNIAQLTAQFLKPRIKLSQASQENQPTSD